MALHSPQLLEHFQNPRNTGSLEPPAVTVEVSNPACGDILRLSALIEDGVIREVRYRVRGCTASIAAGSVLTVILTGRPVAELSGLTAGHIEEAVGGLQPASKHVAALCVDGVRALLQKLPK